MDSESAKLNDSGPGRAAFIDLYWFFVLLL